MFCCSTANTTFGKIGQGLLMVVVVLVVMGLILGAFEYATEGSLAGWVDEIRDSWWLFLSAAIVPGLASGRGCCCRRKASAGEDAASAFDGS